MTHALKMAKSQLIRVGMSRSPMAGCMPKRACAPCTRNTSKAKKKAILRIFLIKCNVV